MSYGKFPVEVWTRICECLNKVHPESMLSFSLASKFCHSLTRPLVFETIHVHIESATQLAAFVETVTVRKVADHGGLLMADDVELGNPSPPFSAPVCPPFDHYWLVDWLVDTRTVPASLAAQLAHPEAHTSRTN